ncbi:MAG TPA: hypothetical protein VGM19_14360 [Armatimonadota bacterium]|jgi:hypothetical protein
MLLCQHRIVVCLALVIVLAASVNAQERQAKPGDVTFSLELITLTDQPEVRTPLLAVTRLTNRSAEPIQVSTGNDTYGALLFLITTPDGKTLSPSADDLNGLGHDLSGLKKLAPGATYTEVAVVNDRMTMRQAGTYRVQAVMADWGHWGGTRAQTPDQWPALGRAAAEVTLGEGSVESRRRLCDWLALRADSGLRTLESGPSSTAWQDPELSKELDRPDPPPAVLRGR